MNQGIFYGLMYNAALLMALGIVFDSITLRNYRNILLAKIVTGLCLGCIALAIMINPFVLRPGVVFDTRSILLCLTALFFGFIPTCIATLMALLYRIWQGGAGVYMGCSVIIASVGWGYLGKLFHGKWHKPYAFLELYLLGIATHITMLALTILLPASIRLDIFNAIVLPVLVLYPVATVFMGQLIARRIIRRKEKYELEASEKQFRNLYENAPLPYQSLDGKGDFITVNKAWLESLGYHQDEVVGKNFAEFLHPDYKEHFARNFPHFKAVGHIEGVEFILIKKDGLPILTSFTGKIVYSEDGKFKQTQCVFTNITEQRKQESALRSIEWMLTKQHIESNSKVTYGDLTELNTSRLILDSIGKDILKELVEDYLSLLDTSAAVYEKNGDYALGIFSSSWCQYLDSVSRKLCNTEDNEEALNCGKWLCHESCWSHISKEAVETGETIDKECNGGLFLYAVPIRTSAGVIGAINLGYGTPPRDEQKRKEIAELYHVDINELTQKAIQYRTRPPFIVEQAKRKLHTAARIIGEIVERKQAELELQKIKQDWEIIFQSIPHPTYILDKDQNVIAANSILEKAMGMSVEQMQGRKCWELMHGKGSLHPPNECPFADSCVHENNFVSEMEVEALGGFYMVSCKPIYDKDGNVDKVIHIAMDITARRSAELILAESEEKYRVLTETAKDIIIVHQMNGSLTYANKIALEFLGAKPDKLNEVNLWNVIVPEYHDMLKQHISERAEGYIGSRLYQLELFNHFGQRRHMEVSSSPIISNDKISGILAVIRDVTERLADQIAIKESEEKYRRLVETANEGILIMDASNVTTFVNKRLAEMVGYTESEIIGEHVNSFMPIDEMQDHKIKLLDRQQGKDDHYERKFIVKDGSAIWVLVSAKAILDKEGKFNGSFVMLTDITTIKHTEQALKESQAMFELFMDNLPGGGFISDKNSKALFVNRYLLDIYGQKGGIGSSPLDTFPPEAAKALLADDRLALEQGFSHSEETTKYPDGTTHINETIKFAIKRDNADSLLGGIVLDVTERKRTEKALADSEARFVHFMNQIPGNVFIKDKHSRFLYVNRVMEQVHGSSTWLGKTPDEVFPEDEAREIFADDQKVLELGIKQMIDCLPDKKGELRYFETTKFIIERENADVLIGGLSLDVTARVKAEEERNQYAQRLEIIHEIDSDILESRSLEEICTESLVHIHKLVPSERCSISACDHTLEDWLIVAIDDNDDSVTNSIRIKENPVGYESDLTAGKSLHIPDINSYSGEISDFRKNLIKQGLVSYLHIPLVMHGDFFGSINFGSSIKNFFTSAQVSIMFDIAKQITIAIQQMHLTKEIARHAEDLESKVEERTEQLKNVNKELESFSYSVAHDLRSPLRTIDGFANILLEDHASQLDEEGKKKLEVIKSSASKMDTLIKELLDLAKLNPYSMKIKQLKMNDIISGVLDNALEPEIRKLFDIQVEKLPNTLADQVLMQQTWQNLITNAIKFTMPKDIKKIIIGSYKRDNEVVFFIKDTGVGFDMRYVDKIFGPFQRLHRAQDFEGTGIGLAIVSKIIQRHNGTIWAESELDKGASFYFTLPLQD